MSSERVRPALPKETAARVILALLAFVSGAIAVGESAWYSIHSDSAQSLANACQLRTPDEPAERADCRERGRERALWSLAWGPGSIALAAAGAGGACLWARRRLRPMPWMKLPAFAATYESVSAGAGFKSPLPLMWRPERPIATARADGILSRYVEVSPGLVSRSLQDPPAAAAALRHELAHHAHRDVAPSRLLHFSGFVTIALGLVFVLTAWEVGARRALVGLARVAILGVIVAVARADVLRAREYEADLRAGQGDPSGLMRSLAGEQVDERRWAWLGRPFAHHPTLARRRTVATEPWRAYSLSTDDLVLAGATGGLAGPILSRVARGWFQYGDPSLYAELIGWGATGLVLGIWLAMALERSAASDPDSRPAFRLSHALAFGGAALVASSLVTEPLILPADPFPNTLLGLVTRVGPVIGLSVAAIWLGGVVAWWSSAQRSENRRASRGLVWFVASTTVGLLSGVIAVLAQLGRNAETNRELSRVFGVDPGSLLTLVQVPLSVSDEWFILPLVGLALAVPLILAVGARSDDDRRRLVEAIWAALIAGGAAVGALLIYRAIWDPIDTAFRNGWYASIWVGLAQRFLVGGVVGLVAATVALRAGRGHLPMVGVTSIVGGAVAGLGTWLVLGGPVEDLEVILLNTVITALSIGLVAGGVLVASGMAHSSRRRTPALPAIGALAAILALLPLAVAARNAEPSYEADVSMFGQVFDRSAEHRTAVDSCLAGDANADLDGLQGLRQQLQAPLGRPAHAAVADVHGHYARLASLCIEAVAAAKAAGLGRLDDSAIAEIQTAFTAFAEGMVALGIIDSPKPDKEADPAGTEVASPAPSPPPAETPTESPSPQTPPPAEDPQPNQGGGDRPGGSQTPPAPLPGPLTTEQLAAVLIRLPDLPDGWQEHSFSDSETSIQCNQPTSTARAAKASAQYGIPYGTTKNPVVGHLIMSYSPNAATTAMVEFQNIWLNCPSYVTPALGATWDVTVRVDGFDPGRHLALTQVFRQQGGQGLSFEQISRAVVVKDTVTIVDFVRFYVNVNQLSAQDTAFTENLTSLAIDRLIKL